MQVWLFDIDGTLITSGGAGQAAMAAAMAESFGTEPDASAVAFAGRTDRSIVSDLFRHHGVKETPSNLASFFAAYLRQLNTTLECRDGGVLPGVQIWLDQLASRDSTHIGLLTGNLQHGARRKLKHYQLWHYFGFGGFGDDHLDRDDVAREALTAAERHTDQSIDVSQVWVVGDTPSDIKCARAIGANVVAVATGKHTRSQLRESGPDVLLDDLSDATSLEPLLS